LRYTDTTNDEDEKKMREREKEREKEKMSLRTTTNNGFAMIEWLGVEKSMKRRNKPTNKWGNDSSP